MVQQIARPAIIKAAGNKPKLIEEYFGRINSGTTDLSIARMISPQGWIEPGQEPEFDEYTIVLRGTLRLKLKDREIELKAGEAVIVEKNEWIQYSTPEAGGAEYISVCRPAFAPDIVHRDTE